ncbi:MAG: hypothetical protein KAW17_09595 [Candidatus Eisenbacteria sp.]|nr:hypothetical protein [Candidatus Eisenbacteria bacterium]
MSEVEMSVRKVRNFPKGKGENALVMEWINAESLQAAQLIGREARKIASAKDLKEGLARWVIEIRLIREPV